MGSEMCIRDSVGRQFFDKMAVAEDSRKDGDEEEEEEEEEQEKQEEFIVPNDEGEPGPSPSYFRSLERREVSPFFLPLSRWAQALLWTLSSSCRIKKCGSNSKTIAIVWCCKNCLKGNFETIAFAPTSTVV